MRKFLVVVLLTVFAIVFSDGHALASRDFSIKKMEGVLKKVEVNTSDFYTILRFEDGRVVTFKGVYEGMIFPEGKKCVVEYRYTNAPFREGTYITNFQCE